MAIISQLSLWGNGKDRKNSHTKTSFVIEISDPAQADSLNVECLNCGGIAKMVHGFMRKQKQGFSRTQGSRTKPQSKSKAPSCSTNAHRAQRSDQSQWPSVFPTKSRGLVGKYHGVPDRRHVGRIQEESHPTFFNTKKSSNRAPIIVEFFLAPSEADGITGLIQRREDR